MSPPETRHDRKRLARLAVLAALIAFAVAALLVLPLWITVLVPRWMFRRAALGLLWTLLALQVLLVAAVPLIGGLALVSLLRARSRRQPRRRAARWLALSVSCLVGLAFMEGGAVWRSWALRYPALPTKFPNEPKSGTGGELRVLVLGESSALGEPFDRWLSIGQIVAWQLEQVWPDRRVSVETIAQGGANLEPIHRRLAQLTTRPDLVLIYSGHNEFQARYPWKREVSHYVDQSFWESPDGFLERLRRSSPLSGLILETIDGQRLDVPPPPKATRHLIDVPCCTAAEARWLLTDYRRHLDAVVAYCARIGALPVVFVPAGNDAGYEPNRSVLAPETRLAKRTEIARQFQAARQDEAWSPDRALAQYQALLERHPEFAEAHFRAARLLEARGDWDAANRHYSRARDLDGMPQRCLTSFQEACRQVAARHNCVLVDGPSLLRERVPHGILDDRQFHDAHHPTFLGYVALAQDLLDQLQKRRALGWPASASRRLIDPVACAEHFGLRAPQWAEVCRHSGEWYRIDAYIRYDPSERLMKGRRYDEAALQIDAGARPEDAGVPGLGTRPRALGITFPPDAPPSAAPRGSF